MTNIYHATPYDISATGFYFETFEEYRDKAASHRNAYGDPVEEYEIQYIDGDQAELFNALSVNQATLKQWFDKFEPLEDDDLIKAIYLARDAGYTMADILYRLEETYIFEGNAQAYVEHFMEETGDLQAIPPHLRHYFDYAAFARDLILGGDITETTILGTLYSVWEA